jgi:hypothetical protein
MLRRRHANVLRPRELSRMHDLDAGVTHKVLHIGCKQMGDPVRLRCFVRGAPPTIGWVPLFPRVSGRRYGRARAEQSRIAELERKAGRHSRTV